MEANGLVKESEVSRELFQETIEKYLRDDPFEDHRDEERELKKGTQGSTSETDEDSYVIVNEDTTDEDNGEKKSA